jgi:hypothetical protein
MDIVALVQYGTPAVLIGLMVSNVWLASVLTSLKDDMKGLKGNITYKDTCTERHTEIDRRLGRLEAKSNGVT